MTKLYFRVKPVLAGLAGAKERLSQNCHISPLSYADV